MKNMEEISLTKGLKLKKAMIHKKQGSKFTRQETTLFLIDIEILTFSLLN